MLKLQLLLPSEHTKKALQDAATLKVRLFWQRSALLEPLSIL